MSDWFHKSGDIDELGPDDVKSLGTMGLRLAKLSAHGLPVPHNFILTSDLCKYICRYKHFPDGFEDELKQHIGQLEHQHGGLYGDANQPIFLSVRPSPITSFAGLAAPIRHLGFSWDSIQALLGTFGRDGDEIKAHMVPKAHSVIRALHKFLFQYSELLIDADPEDLETIIDENRTRLAQAGNDEAFLAALRTHVAQYQSKLDEEYGETIPFDPFEQLLKTIKAMCLSWSAPRAVLQRQIHEIGDDESMALIVQVAQFADRDAQSGKGIFNTRDPKSGADKLNGVFGWQIVDDRSDNKTMGEDNTNDNMEARGHKDKSTYSAQTGRIAFDEAVLRTKHPEIHDELKKIAVKVEELTKRPQEMKITIESGKIWLDECREFSASASAELKISVDLAKSGLISRNEALSRIDPKSLEQVLHPSIAPESKGDVIGNGVPASPGAAAGKIVFNSDDAIEATRDGQKVIFVRTETSPEDVHGMQVSEGILTIKGGVTSHAAVIARGMGTPCVCGARNVRLDEKNQTLMASGRILKTGDIITIDGSSGDILYGKVTMQEPELSDEFQQLMQWADEARRMDIRTNVESPSDARTARQFGAEGVGLCRTEHMFFDDERIMTMRQMILAENEIGRREALAKLLPMQESDFVELFKEMNGLPVTIRLLDPPLHEFLPQNEAEMLEISKRMGISVDVFKRRVNELSEFNPMLGHRGCRLAISHPEITEMQARAIFQAAIIAARETGAAVVPEIMVPLVALKKELDFVKERIQAVARNVMLETGQTLHYLVGTMIELPRAVIRADAIAQSAEFFSFGTNDLTQMTFGISRDDASTFLKTYRERGIVDRDPFASLDFEGVGELISLATKLGRGEHGDLKIGICGEHGGDPVSIQFCEKIGLDYVSCSPFRVPIARLAAAQAAIKFNA